MLTLLLVSCALRLGSPDLASLAVSPGDVVVASAEPGLREALSEGFNAALAARGALAPQGGTLAGLTVLDASTVALAASDAGQVHQARLRLAVQVYGPQPRRVVLSAERSYSVLPSASLSAAEARAQAFEALARSLTEDAVLWILLSPPVSP